MTGYLSLGVYLLILLVFPVSAYHYARVSGSRFPGVSTAFLFVVMLLLPNAFPPLRSLSCLRILHALGAEYLDLFWIIFYASAIMLLSGGIRRKSLTIAIITALSFFAATGGSATFARDISRDSVYRLKLYTQTLLDRLDSECIITWYRTDSFAESVSGTALSIFLDRYARENPEYLRLYSRDPLADESSSFPEKLGLTPLASGSYSGFLIEYRGSSRLIPVLAGHTLAEYELTRALESLVDDPRDYRVQIYIPANPGTAGDYLGVLLEHAGFTIIPVHNPAEGLNEHIPLVMIGSHDDTVETARELERFLDRGGNALFLVSGTDISVDGDWSAREKTDDAVIALLQQRGIAIKGQLVRDTDHYTIIMNALDSSSVETVPYPYWVRIPDSGFPANHPLFAGVSSLLLYWPSPITIFGNAGLPLIRTSRTAQSMDPPFDTRPLAASGLAKGNEGVVLTLGAFRDDGSRLIVIADEHAVSTLNDFTAGWDNYLFFVNCVEWLSGRDYLSRLKRREPASFPFLRRLFP